MDEQTLFTAYDEAMQTKELQILKTILPYASPQVQNTLSFLIQFIQFKNASNYQLTAAEIVDPQERNTALLNDIRKFCSPKEQETIDTLLNIICVMDNYESIIG